MASSPRIDELQKKFDENPRRYFAPLANEYRKIGDIDQAIFICQEYLPQQPGHMSGHIVFGQALFEAGRYDEAKAVFETALTLDPENLIALRHLGDIARGLGDPATARTWYQRVLEADPRNEEIAAALASLPADQPVPATPDDGHGVESSPAEGAAAPEPVIDIPLETEPTESPLADFAGIVDEVRTEAVTGAPEAPAAELTIPHASTDSEPLDLDAVDFSFGTSSTSAPKSPEPIAAPATEPAPPAPIPTDFALELQSPSSEASPASTASAPAVGAPAADAAASAPVLVLDGLEAAEHQPPADSSAFAPLEGLDVLEGSFMAPSVGEPAASPSAAAQAPVVPPPAAAATTTTDRSSEPQPSGASATSTPDALPNLDEDLDALFAESTAASTSAPTAPEPPPRTTTPPVIGQAAAGKDLPPLPLQPPARTPAWGMPDLEVPGWEVAAPPPPPTPPIPTQAVPSHPSTDFASPRASERTPEAEPLGEAAASAPAPFVTETMAELYVQQGHREAAIGIYRQLIADHPDDQSLCVRLAELESLSAAMATDTSDAPPEVEATTIRDFLAALAACRPHGGNGTTAHAAQEETESHSRVAQDTAAVKGADDFAATGQSAAPLEGLPVLEDTWSGGAASASSSAPPDLPAAADAPRASDVSPKPDVSAAPSTSAPPDASSLAGTTAIPRASAASAEAERPSASYSRRRDSGTVGGSLDLLFGDADSADTRRGSEPPRAPTPESAAGATEPHQADGAMGGAPARPAANELSLDVVFREPTPSASHEAGGFSFDQFFSQSANDRRPSPATPEQAGSTQQGPGTDDIEQFNAWLEGLKKS